MKCLFDFFFRYSFRARDEHVPVSTFTRMMMCCDDPLVRDVRNFQTACGGKWRRNTPQKPDLSADEDLSIASYPQRDLKIVLPRFLFEFIGNFHFWVIGIWFSLTGILVYTYGRCFRDFRSRASQSWSNNTFKKIPIWEKRRELHELDNLSHLR